MKDECMRGVAELAGFYRNFTEFLDSFQISCCSSITAWAMEQE